MTFEDILIDLETDDWDRNWSDDDILLMVAHYDVARWQTIMAARETEETDDGFDDETPLITFSFSVLIAALLGIACVPNSFTLPYAIVLLLAIIIVRLYIAYHKMKNSQNK